MGILTWLMERMNEKAFRRQVRLAEKARTAIKPDWETLDDKIKSYSISFNPSDVLDAYAKRQDTGNAKFFDVEETAEAIFEEGIYALYVRIGQGKVFLKPIVRQPPYGNVGITGVDEVADLIIECGDTSARLALNVLKVAVLDYKKLEGRMYNAKLEKK